MLLRIIRVFVRNLFRCVVFPQKSAVSGSFSCTSFCNSHSFSVHNVCLGDCFASSALLSLCVYAVVSLCFSSRAHRDVMCFAVVVFVLMPRLCLFSSLLPTRFLFLARWLVLLSVIC